MPEKIGYLKEQKNGRMKNNLKTLEQFINEEYDLKGTTTRNKFEKGYESFKLEQLNQEKLPEISQRQKPNRNSDSGIQ